MYVHESYQIDQIAYTSRVSVEINANMQDVHYASDATT